MNEPSLNQFLIFSAALFCIGIYGLLSRRNLIAMLMAVELILNSAALNFVAFHHYKFGGEVGGAVFPVFIIAIAAAEAAIVLAILISLFRHKKELDVEQIDTLKH
ncbi:MAG: NADH-quinone oxidoreductase subunit NuoK [Verrucomicrobiia bacterium]